MGGTYFYFKNSEAPHFSISDRMHRCINLCLNDAQASAPDKVSTAVNYGSDCSKYGSIDKTASTKYGCFFAGNGPAFPVTCKTAIRYLLLDKQSLNY